MEEIFGVLCLLALAPIGIIAGFWVMHQRISQLQKRLFEVERKLTHLELASPPTLPAAPSAAAAPPPSLSPGVESASPAASAAPTQMPEPTPVAEQPSTADATSIPAPRDAASAASTLRPQTLPPPTTIPATPPPAAPAHDLQRAAATLARIPLVERFLRMHLLVQIGLVVLLVGVALLLRYAVDQGWLSIELRHLGAAAGGAALGVAGWFAARKQRGYGLALQGGGLAILYLTTFSAYAVYALLPATVAFGFYTAISAFGVLLALLQDARLLAYVALVGAFAAPVLAADGSGAYVGLLGYYVLLTLTALALAWRKGWQGLALLSVIGVYGIGILNSAVSFTPEDFLGTLAFILFFFGLFLAASLALALRPGAGRRVLDLVIAVINPIAALYWIAVITDNSARQLGYALVAGGVIYLALFGWLAWKQLDKLAVQRELSLFWALFLLSLAAPVFVEAQVTAVVWAVAGALWVWLSWRRSVAWLTFWGMLTQAAAGLYLTPSAADAVARVGRIATDDRPFLNEFTFGWGVLALAGLATAWLLGRMAQRGERPAQSTLLRGLSVATFIWGAMWWFGGGLLEATTLPDSYVASAAIAFLAISTVLMDGIGQRLRFALLSTPLWGLLPALAVLAIVQVEEINSPLQGGAWLVWPLALAAHLWMLRRFDSVRAVAPYHAGGVWLLAFLAVAATNGLLGLVDAAITLLTGASLTVLAGVAGAATMLVSRLPTPLRARAALYRLWGAGPVLLVSAIGTLLAASTQSGAMTPLAYIPILNPLALASAAVLGVALIWIVMVRRERGEPVRSLIWGLRWVWWALLIFCLSAELARSVHHLQGMPLTWRGLYTTPLFQTLLAVLWSVIALGLMLWGSRRRSRASWFAGASVLGLTVIKLFLVDLAGVGAVARIVSFIGVGVLILVIAFVAPAPPREEVERLGD